MPDNKYHFEKLTPIDNVDMNVYENAIDFVFKNNDIKNVAITGAYSSGKSSVLASYKKKHQELQFMHISLAHFKSPGQEKKDEHGQDKIDESALETKILNQLIHQIPSDKIPQTNFRIKKKLDEEHIKHIKHTVILFFTAIIYFICFDTWKNYVNNLPDTCSKYILMITTHPYALMADGILIIILLSSFIGWLIGIQKTRNILHKVNLQGNEIEIYAENDESYFDKYLNEVLYLFENTDTDVIVFEDIDRYNAQIIFERLREINTLANLQLEKDGKVLRFFYLLRDDIYDSKDRTKFFDYIIPIVPVVDSSNSFNQFILHFKNTEIYERLDEGFLQGLSLYIDDMRLLKNIYNEFVIYFNRLNTTELNCNKMLAIITYKNIFPRDFADLQLNRGFVYTLFSKKENFITAEITEINKRIDKIQKRITSSENEYLVSIRELDAVFADKYFKHYHLSNETDSDLTKFIIKNLDTDQKDEYTSRKQTIEDKLNKNNITLNQEIQNLQQKEISLQNESLYKIITRDNIDEIFSITSINDIDEEIDFNEIKSNEYFDLLKYLIRNGYIDETYTDYMTYFYENSLSRTDKIFLRSITDKKAKDYTYHLENPEKVVSYLRLLDFDQEEILNFDLLTYLLSNQSYDDYLDRLLTQLKESMNFNFVKLYFDITTDLNFVKLYLGITTELPEYVKRLNIIWPDLFNELLTKNNFSESQIHKYSIYSIYYSDDNALALINKDNCLSDYISNKCDYLAIEEPDIDKLIHGFKLLNVSFAGFDYVTANKNLLKEVYNNSLYVINNENIRLIQKEILNVTNSDDIIHKNYTLMTSHPDSTLTQYINQNINEYIDVVIEMCDGKVYDDENVVIDLLNNDDLTLERKLSYITVLETIITNISKIEDNILWTPLLNTDKVQYSESNLMDCFNTLGLTSTVISYINRCNIDLDFSKYECHEGSKAQLFDSISVCNDVDNSKYKQIMLSLGFKYNNPHCVDISADKLNILIDTKIIQMTEDNLKFIRLNYHEQLFHFISANIGEYIEIMTDRLLEQEELLEILDWDISDEQKIKLLELTDSEISIIDKNYSNAVTLYILKNNYDESDSRKLFLSYEDWDNSIKDIISNYAAKDIRSIIDDPSDVSKELIINLFNSNKITQDEKIDLFISLMPNLKIECIKEFLKLLNLKNYLKIFESHSRPRFEINDENDKLLQALKENNLIDDYYENPTMEGYYKISKKRNSN